MPAPISRHAIKAQALRHRHKSWNIHDAFSAAPAAVNLQVRCPGSRQEFYKPLLPTRWADQPPAFRFKFIILFRFLQHPRLRCF